MNKMKKIFLLTLFLIATIPFVVANDPGAVAIRQGRLFTDNVLETDTSLPIDFYLGDQVRYTTQIGDNIVNPVMQSTYFHAEITKYANDTSDRIIAKVYGLQGYNGTWTQGVIGYGNITINITKLADNETAEHVWACQSGAYCVANSKCGLCPTATQTQVIVAGIDTTVTNPDSINETGIDFYADITTNTGVAENVEITYSNTNLGGAYGLNALGKWYNITPQGPINLSHWILKIYYTDAEVANLKENTLRISYYNETSGNWEDYNAPRGGVDTANNYVWANLTHFSVYGVYGTRKITYTGGGGGGGGGSYTFLTTTNDTAPVDTTPPVTNPPATNTGNENSDNSANTGSSDNAGSTDGSTDVQTGQETPVQETSGNEITGAAVTGLTKGTKAIAIIAGALLIAGGGFFMFRKYF